jgi:hypothetical protein
VKYTSALSLLKMAMTHNLISGNSQNVLLRVVVVTPVCYIFAKNQIDSKFKPWLSSL